MVTFSRISLTCLVCSVMFSGLNLEASSVMSLVMDMLVAAGLLGAESSLRKTETSWMRDIEAENI